MKEICLIPGSFDPPTMGHLDIIRRAAKQFAKVRVAVLVNADKHPAFSLEQRMDMLRRATADIAGVTVESFSGLTAEYARRIGADVIVRGLRNAADYSYEAQVFQVNSHLFPGLETLFLMTATEYGYLSSSIVREIAKVGGNVRGLVPDVIVEDVERVLGSQGRVSVG